MLADVLVSRGIFFSYIPLFLVISSSPHSPTKFVRGTAILLLFSHISWWFFTRSSIVYYFLMFTRGWRAWIVFCRKGLSLSWVSKYPRYLIVSIQKILFSALTLKHACSTFASTSFSLSKWSLNKSLVSTNSLSNCTFTYSRKLIILDFFN